jgi:hypothetical protein
MLVVLSSWGFLSGFLLPIGITRPDICPFTDTTGPTIALSTSALAAATFTSRLGEWFQIYTFEPPQLPSNVLINNRPVVANWKYVPTSKID